MLVLLETALASGYSIDMCGKWKKQKENPVIVIRLREWGRGCSGREVHNGTLESGVENL